MHKYIFAILTADEAKPLASLNHFTVPVSNCVPISIFYLNFLLRKVAGGEKR